MEGYMANKRFQKIKNETLIQQQVVGSFFGQSIIPYTFLRRPPPDAGKLGAEALRYVKETHGQFATAIGGDRRSKQKHRRRQRSIVGAWKRFVESWNGQWELRGSVVRYEPVGSPRSRVEIVSQMASDFSGAVLRQVPPPPESGKWTK
jgi:hypothetical protein